MSYNILPSLEHLATVSVASLVYNDTEIGRMLQEEKCTIHSNCYSEEVWEDIAIILCHDKEYTDHTDCNIDDAWKVIEKKIMEDLPPLLPSLLKIKVAKVIRPMNKEVSWWKKDHAYLLKHFGDYSPIYNSCLCWRTDGTINREQTTKKLLMNESIDPKIRFITACIYFLEDEVLALWEKMKEVDKKRITETGTNSAVRFWMKKFKKGDTKHWWMKWQNKEEVRHWSEMIDEFFRNENLISRDTPLRISSFYNYLSWENKQKYIGMFIINMFVHNDDLRMCLKNKGEVERREIFRSSPVIALLTCLRWPFRSRFIEMAEKIMSYLRVDQFWQVVVIIMDSYIYNGYEDFQLLEEFWQMSPAALKDAIMSNFRYFFEDEDLREYAKPSLLLALKDALKL